jgi:copper(I)-binding protein
MGRRMAITLMISFSLVVPQGFAVGQTDVSATDAWVKLAPPGSMVNAAYMQLHNHSSDMRAIVAVSADCCAEIMMHQSRRVGDKVFMEHLDTLEIPAKSVVMLMPGGLHLMLLGAQVPLRVSDEVNLTLTFADGNTQTVTALVKRSADD